MANIWIHTAQNAAWKYFCCPLFPVFRIHIAFYNRKRRSRRRSFTTVSASNPFSQHTDNHIRKQRESIRFFIQNRQIQQYIPVLICFLSFFTYKHIGFIYLFHGNIIHLYFLLVNTFFSKRKLQTQAVGFILFIANRIHLLSALPEQCSLRMLQCFLLSFFLFVPHHCTT